MQKRVNQLKCTKLPADINTQRAKNTKMQKDKKIFKMQKTQKEQQNKILHFPSSYEYFVLVNLMFGHHFLF